MQEITRSDNSSFLNAILSSAKNVTVDEFISYMEQELHWKSANFVQQSKKEEFLCSCKGGKSIINEIKRTAKEIGVEIRVTPIDNLKTDPDHLYKVEIVSGINYNDEKI